MAKPIQTLIFRPINGIWTDTRENAGILADFLAANNLLIDDRTQFARIYDYDEGIEYLYRASADKVEVEMWAIPQ